MRSLPPRSRSIKGTPSPPCSKCGSCSYGHKCREDRKSPDDQATRMDPLKPSVQIGPGCNVIRIVAGVAGHSVRSPGKEIGCGNPIHRYRGLRIWISPRILRHSLWLALGKADEIFLRPVRTCSIHDIKPKQPCRAEHACNKGKSEKHLHPAVTWLLDKKPPLAPVVCRRRSNEALPCFQPSSPSTR